MPEKKKRTKVPQENKVRAELQQEINSVCPFCENTDVGHFEIHHMDDVPSNHDRMNLLLLCPTCHSKITKGDISKKEVYKRKSELLSNLLDKKAPFLQNANLTFNDGSTELTCHPKFKQVGTYYITKPQSEQSLFMLNSLHQQQTRMHTAPHRQPHTNLSFFKVTLVLHNTGSLAIEEYKILLNFEGEIEDLAKNNLVNNYPIIPSHVPPTVLLDRNTKSGKIVPNSKILVGEDKFESEIIYIKTPPKESTICIKWKLISKTVHAKGELYIKVVPVIEKNYSEVYVENQNEERINHGEIKECLV